jgi:hypothetical protein
MDEDFIIEALEKMRDYIAQENKRYKDELFKLRLEFETKVREKLDKKDLEDIEKRMMENVELSIANRTKKYVEKPELKKYKLAFDKQVKI